MAKKPKKRKTPTPRPDNLNTRLYDDAVVRAVHNLKYREDLIKRASLQFRVHDEEWLTRLGGVLVRMSDADMKRIGSGINLNRATDRTKALVVTLRDLAKSSRDIARRATTELKELAFDEAVFWNERVKHHMPDGIEADIRAPGKAEVNKMWSQWLIGGETINQQIDRWAVQRAQIMRGVIRQRAFEGLTASAMISGLGGKGGMMARNVDGNPNGLGLKLRTAVTASSSAGQKAFAAENDLINDLVWTAVLDTRTSKICTARHGRLVNKELGGALPPAHPNCLPGDRLVAPCGRIAAISKRWFDGETVTINTALHKPLTVTPNHPVLTQRGWIAAGEISVGDQIVRSGFRDGVSAAVSGDDQNLVTRFDDLYESLLESGDMIVRRSPSAAPDFHGDGTEGQINEILVHKDFALEGDAASGENAFHSPLVNRFSNVSAGSSFLSLQDFFLGVLATTTGFVRRVEHSLPLLWGGVSPSLAHSLAQGSSFDASSIENGFNLSARHAVSLSQGGHGFAHEVAFDNIVSRPLGFKGVDPISTPFAGHTGLLEDAVNSVSSNPETLLDVWNGFSGDVEFHDVVSVERRKFSGHVYNLETESGFYHADEAVVHNCRSITVPGVYNIKRAKELSKKLPADSLDIRGRIPEHETAEEWLIKQTEETQRKVLGTSRFGLWQTGKFKWPDDFVNARSGEVYTLARLRERNKAYFKGK